MKTSPSVTLTDNELIAEFMGFTFAFERGHRIFNVPEGEELKYQAHKLSIVKMNYDTSWDWLIPVVEKISNEYDVKIIFYNTSCTCYIEKQNLEGTEIASYGNFKPHIENVFKTVVRFIKWYNAQKI